MGRGNKGVFGEAERNWGYLSKVSLMGLLLSRGYCLYYLIEI